MKAFYSWVFENQEKNIRTTHISLYMFLLNQNNRNNWVEWFKCPFDLAMAGSGITNKKTYYNTLLELQDFGLIAYKKGINNYKAPLIKIEVLFDTSTVPQSEPQLPPQVIPLPEPLLQPHLLPNIKLLTNNLKPITLNIKEVLSFLKTKQGKEIDALSSKGLLCDEEKEILTKYTEEEFLEDWKQCRKSFLNLPTHITKLKSFDTPKFNEAINEYSKQQIREAMRGLFMQEVIKFNAMKTQPSHFLENVDKYYNAFISKDKKLYGSKPVQQ